MISALKFYCTGESCLAVKIYTDLEREMMINPSGESDSLGSNLDHSYVLFASYCVFIF